MLCKFKNRTIYVIFLDCQSYINVLQTLLRITSVKGVQINVQFCGKKYKGRVCITEISDDVTEVYITLNYSITAVYILLF